MRKSEFMKTAGNAFKLLDSKQGEGIIRVYPHNLMCDHSEDGWCHFLEESSMHIVDNNHPSRAMAGKISAEVFRLMAEKGWLD